MLEEVRHAARRLWMPAGIVAPAARLSGAGMHQRGTRPMITAHADIVGSLLRPPELLAAREDVAAGRIAQAAFKAIEDRAVDHAIALQEEAGMEVITDGEM